MFCERKRTGGKRLPREQGGGGIGRRPLRGDKKQGEGGPEGGPVGRKSRNAGGVEGRNKYQRKVRSLLNLGRDPKKIKKNSKKKKKERRRV